MKFVDVLILTVALCSISSGSRILGIFPMPSKSHYILGEALLRGLAQKGHNVTLISPFRSEKSIMNYRQVVMNGMLDLREKYGPRFTSINITLWEKVNVMLEMFPAFAHMSHNNSNVLEFLQQGEKFDLCIVSYIVMESMYGICHAVQAPAIGFSTVGMSTFISYHTNNPVPYSYVPSPFLSITDDMTLMDRLKNTVTWILVDGIMKYILLPHQNSIVQKYYPNSPPLDKLLDDVDLILMNAHISTQSPKPLLTNVIPIGGFHLQVMDGIPNDIRNFMDAAKKGVIYFSMGSNVKSSDFHPAMRSVLLKTFAKLDYDIVWKFETDLSNKPKNVYIGRWLPQRAILMHPKVKMFITHGGLGGMVESIYAGVPMICLPVFGDQGMNCAESVNNGYAIQLKFADLTEEKLMAAIKEIESNYTYKEKIMLKSDLYRNQEINPMDKAIFWAEHVIRHKGAKHLKSKASSIPWYEYYLLDVLALIFGILFIILRLIYYVIKLNWKIIGWMVRNRIIKDRFRRNNCDNKTPKFKQH